MSRHLLFSACACAILLSLTTNASAQTGYGVDSTGNLFSFDVTVPGSIPIVAHGNLGFVPEAIDFKPGTNQLYAIDVGPNTVQLYTVNIVTGAATPTSASFNSTGAGYNLTGNQHFGFDFIPNTSDGSGNFHIRVTGTNGNNLRVNSATGALTSADTDLLIQPGSSAPFIDASAYLNNVPSTGATPTTLYDLDIRNNKTYTQAGNAGTLTLLGSFGAGITDALVGVGFDIYTDPSAVNPTLGDNHAYAVLKRTSTIPGSVYLLYQVNLTDGSIFNGKLVGPPGTPSDFTGGFSMAPLPIPEPTALALLTLALLATATIRRRLTPSPS
jgi:hypothetical protein